MSVNHRHESDPAMSSIVMSVDYFVDLPDLKRVISELREDITTLCGPNRLIIATRKRKSIGDQILRNKAICRTTESDLVNTGYQRCGARGCKSCKLMVPGNEVLLINGRCLKVSEKFNCKTSSVIYVAQCRLYDSSVIGTESTYFGQTVQEFHSRLNGHRSKFKSVNKEYEKSALALHAFTVHPKSFNLDIFKVAIVKKVNPNSLNREEYRFYELCDNF